MVQLHKAIIQERHQTPIRQKHLLLACAGIPQLYESNHEAMNLCLRLKKIDPSGLMSSSNIV